MPLHPHGPLRRSNTISTRRGFSWLGIVVAFALVGTMSLAAWAYLPWNQTVDVTAQAVTHPVNRGSFRYFVAEQGEIESSSNVEVRCEVQSRNSAGTAILQIVPEGTVVAPGDLIALLDKSALENEFNQQQIVCNGSEAAVIQAESTLQTANISKQEYLQGTFRQEEQLILGEISVAEENLRRAEDYLIYSEKLAAKGYVTQLQLEADRFAVEKARMELETAQTKLDVLRNFTRAKMVSQLDADIKIAEANLASQRNSHELDKEKLELIRAQIEKCEIRAPAAGEVVYANETDRRGSTEFIIEEGALLRERQVIVRLPDPKQMQVRAKINEARVDRVREGMPVQIKLDAFPKLDLQGVVKSVDEYPLPTSWYGANIKEYATYIEVFDPPEGIRPGMTAEVRIRVAEYDDVLQVPIQAVTEHGGRHYCLVRGASGLEARPVEIGISNEKFVIIEDGLSEIDVVLMSPREFFDQVDLPAVPAPGHMDEKMIAERDSDPSEESGEGDSAKEQDESSDTARVVAARPEGDGDDSAQRPEGQRRSGPPGSVADMDPTAMAQGMLQRFDRDHDGRLSEDELPEQMRAGFASSDRNGDGFLDADEMAAMIRRFAALRAAGGGGGPGPQAGGAGL